MFAISSPDEFLVKLIRNCMFVIIYVCLFHPSHYFLKPRLHDTTCCQTGLTTGCIVYTIQTFNRLSNPFDNRGLTIGCIVYTAGCQPGCKTRFDNWLNEQWLFVQHGCQTGCKTGLTTGLTTGCIV